MFYVLSRIFWFFARPLNLLFFLAAVCGLVLAFRPVTRLALWARAGLGISALLFCLIGFTQFADWAILRLETAVSAARLPEQPDGIIVLGGGLSANPAATGVAYSFGESSDRLIRGLELRRQYPAARLIYSGGSAGMTDAAEPETSAALAAVRALYGDTRGIEIEPNSLNTWQNAEFVAEMIGEGRSGTWILVTSAFHMPRALGCFRKVGVDVVPAPADYRADALVPPYITGSSPEQFLKIAIVVKELIGLAAYRLTGRIDRIFPS